MCAHNETAGVTQVRRHHCPFLHNSALALAKTAATEQLLLVNCWRHYQRGNRKVNTFLSKILSHISIDFPQNTTLTDCSIESPVKNAFIIHTHTYSWHAMGKEHTDIEQAYYPLLSWGNRNGWNGMKEMRFRSSLQTSFENQRENIAYIPGLTVQKECIFESRVFFVRSVLFFQCCSQLKTFATTLSLFNQFLIL